MGGSAGEGRGGSGYACGGGEGGIIWENSYTWRREGELGGREEVRKKRFSRRKGGVGQEEGGTVRG